MPHRQKQQCNYCREALHHGAQVCYCCGRDQRKWINTLQYLATSTAFIMVIIVIAQVFISNKQIKLSEVQNKLSEEQYKESKLKHVEAEDVLKKAESNSRLAFTVTSSNFYKTKVAIETSSKLITNANERSVKVGADIEALRNQTASELEVLKRRNRLTMLADKVITSGDRNTFIKMYHYATDSKDTSGISEILRVKNFYAAGDRIGTPSLEDKTELGPIKDVSTESIIVSMKGAKNWEFRGMTVKVLQFRKEKIAVEALLDVIKNDDNLAVMRAALHSFSALTGYQTFDVFDNLPDLRVTEWWKANKEKVERELK